MPHHTSAKSSYFSPMSPISLGILFKRVVPMACTKKASQKVRDNLASLAASQTTAGIHQGSTQVNGDQESQSESQPAPVTATQSLSPSRGTPRAALAEFAFRAATPKV